MAKSKSAKAEKIFSDNPIKPGEKTADYYLRIASISEFSVDSVRNRYHNWKTYGSAVITPPRDGGKTKGPKEAESTYTAEGAELKGKSERPITSEEELVKFFEIDLDKWIIDKWKCGAYDVSMKVGEKGLERTVKRTNYTVQAFMSRKSILDIKTPVPHRKIDVGPTGDVQMWLAFGCTHRPFHNQRFWDGMMRCAMDYQDMITGVVNMGDYVDVRSLSGHEEWIPEGIDLGVEYSSGLQGVTDIQDVLPGAKKIAIFGNHCDRTLRNKNELRKFGDSLVPMEEAVGYNKYGWEVLKNWKQDYVDLGDARLFHGDLAGKTAAQQTLANEPDKNSVFVHTHRFSSATNKHFGAFNVGWGGDKYSPAFDYMPRTMKNGWRNGFAFIYVLPNGKSEIRPVPADEKGNFFFQGKIY